MGEGAPDYTHLRQILGKDAAGNLVTVRVDPYGRIILLPYGVQTVEQESALRTIQGIEEETLHTIAVDSEGRLIMLPYGWDGSVYRKLKVDEEGRMISAIKGAADVKWGLRGWWKFIASEETTIKDYSGYNNNGSALSGVAAEAKYIDGVIGQGFEFDGTDDYINCGSGDTLDDVNELSWECWLYCKSYAVRNMFLSKFHKIVEITDDGRISGSIATDGTTGQSVSSEPITLNVWTHIIITYSDSGDRKMRIYANGTEVSYSVQTASTGTVNSEAVKDFLIGSYTSALFFFTGYIDEVRLYARVLSLNEIAWRYEHTNPATGKPTRMVAVDNEGHMMVNIEGLPYKDQILTTDFVKSTAAASTIDVYSDPVPQGKLWVIESCNIDHGTDAIGTLQIGIDRGGVFSKFVENMEAGVNDTLRIDTPLYLKGGDKLRSRFLTVSNNIYCFMYSNGYELDIG